MEKNEIVSRMDVIIIGAGIIGSAIARVLSQYKNLQIHLVEKAPDVGWGASKANTAIIHPGYEDDPKKYPLRAKLCVKGNRLWHKWTKELEIPVKWPGELMIALEKEDLTTARNYLHLAQKNSVPEVQMIYKNRLQSLEPNITREAVGALWAPNAGQIAPWEAVIALVENAVDNGVKLHVETKVEDIKVKENKVHSIITNRRTIHADIVINSAGLYADEVAQMVGKEELSIHPRRGEYYIFEDDATPNVGKILHQTPTPKTKGVYVISTVEGNLMIGPTAQDLPKNEKENTATTDEGLEFIWNGAQKLVRALPAKKQIMKSFAGLRPEPPNGQWEIDAYDDPWGFVNVAGIRSPGFTGAPAIAYYVKKLIHEKLGIRLVKKEDWNPYRQEIDRFSELETEIQAKMIQENPRYGNVVCMCKEVTEAEILKAIRRMKKIGIDTITLDGIKFRTLAMFGACQASFCRLKIARVIAKELGIPIWNVSTKGNGTQYGIGDIKSLRKKEHEEDAGENHVE